VRLQLKKLFLTDLFEYVQDDNTHNTDPDEGELTLSVHNSILTHNMVRDVVGHEP
jgi:hypothetical protein